MSTTTLSIEKERMSINSQEKYAVDQIIGYLENIGIDRGATDNDQTVYDKK